MKAKLILIGLVAVIGLGVFAYTQQGKAENSITAIEDTKTQQIAKLEAVMMEIKDKDSQEYKEAKQQYCLLKSRPAAEREQAVANVKEFLGMPDVPVDFTCGRGDSEYYTAARFAVTIDPKTNYIIEVGEAERRWGTREDGTRWFDPMPEYDYSGRYSTPEEVKKVAEKFLTEHKDILGIDITKMTYKFEGTKPGNFFMNWQDTEHPYSREVELCGNLGEGSVDATYEGAYQRADGTWCVKRQSVNNPQVDITITNGGQIIIYRNNINDLDKL